MSNGTAIDLAVLDGAAIGYTTPLLSSLHLRLAQGEALFVVGPNGGGKSTLVKTLIGVLKPLAGRVEFPSGRPRIGYVPQRERFDPVFPFCALDVVALGLVPSLHPWQRLSAQHYQRARMALAEFDVAELAQRPFRELSGGQQQRVLLARAVATDPELIVLDEPLAALDRASTAAIERKLAALKQENRTLVVITHSLAFARRLATRVVAVDHRLALCESFPPEHLDDTAFVERVFGNSDCKDCSYA